MKIEQLKQQIKICSDSVDWLVDHRNKRVHIDNQQFIELIRLISTTDTIEAAELEDAIKILLIEDRLNIISAGKIYAVLNILLRKYENITNSYKIFISHAFKDAAVIDKFINSILRLGCGIERSNIFCASIEDMGIKTGNDMRERIKNGIALSDYIFLMVSRNYIMSKVCLNELGASFALGKKVKPFLFPQLKYKSVWLSEILKNSPIDNSDTLDTLRDELICEYGLTISATTDWNRQKNDFLAYINQSAS